jgi:hypothetical protein
MTDLWLGDITREQRRAWRDDPRAAILALADRDQAVARLDCGDNSCTSPIRQRGGMRTNGGCRCDPLAVALLHVRLAMRAVVRRER